MMVLQLIWIVIAIILTIPCALFILLIVLVKVLDVARINLKDYGEYLIGPQVYRFFMRVRCMGCVN